MTEVMTGNRTPLNKAGGQANAVVQVDDDGTATLYLGTELVQHTAAASADTILRMLLDYTCTIDTPVTVTTTLPDGQQDKYRIRPDGTFTAISPRAMNRRPAGQLDALLSNNRPKKRRGPMRGGDLGSWWLVIGALIISVVAILATLMIYGSG